MMDEMAIKKHISWDGKKYNSYADLGNGMNDDSLPVAGDALVFMVIAIDESWKVLCGYFFIDGLSGAERANLVNVVFNVFQMLERAVTKSYLLFQ